MEKILDLREQQEGKIVRELLGTMTENEKNIFRAYLKTRTISEDIKKELE